jgi:hypothetical protein
MQRIDGRYAWNVQCAGNMRSIILNKSTKTAKQFGFYAWNVQCEKDHAQHNPLKQKNPKAKKHFGLI